MTNSFQSTAFQSATSPVDTFVQPVTVQPKSGAEELAEILQAVNPGLQAFIGQKIEDKVEEEKIKFQNIACLLYTSPSPRDRISSRMPSSA